MRSLPVTALICLSLLAACASPVTEPSLTPQESTRPSPAPSAVSTPAPSPTLPSPTAAEADVLAHGSARDVGMQIRMAPGPDGTVFVSIPQDGGSLLALLDATGVPRPGWPIIVRDAAWCNNVLPVADGSVRVVCSLGDESGTSTGSRHLPSMPTPGSSPGGPWTHRPTRSPVVCSAPT